MSVYTTGIGGTIRLGATLGKGGEGTVYAVEGDPKRAAKIYLQGFAPERHGKVVAMVDAKLHASTDFVAFPVDTLFDRSGSFAGFAMRKVGGRKPVHELYSPTSRKTAFPSATYPLLIRAASNVARAMASVHAAGCVVGDINHSGVLISDDATAVLIDSDSFQFSRAGRLYPCAVGVPEFTPPELQGKSLGKIIRTTNHDAFGLAVLIFYALIMGRHPFAGLDRGPEVMPMDRAIAEFRFAYSTRRATTKMEPPPNVPTLADLPQAIGDAFELAFGPAGLSSARPSAAEWIALLDKAEAEIVQCSHSQAHHYFRAGPACPWCRMEGAYPGFQAFAPTLPVRPDGIPLNLGQLIAAVRGVVDPGPAPDLMLLMPPVVGLRPSQSIIDLRKARLMRRAGAIIGASIALALLASPGVGPVIGLFGLVASAVVGFQAPAAQAPIRKSAEQARARWRDAERSFDHTAGNELFHKVRQDAESLIQQLQKIPGEETRLLAELDSKRHTAQMRRHLERHPIDRVKITGVGNARKLILKSYGIETAADVDYHRIVAIRGFGPSSACTLLAWRRQVETAFRFDANQGVSPLDIAAVKSDIARRHADMEARLRQTTAALQKASSDAFALRANPPNASITTWTAWKQAETDEKELSSSSAEIKPLVVFTIGGLVFLTVASQVGRTPGQSAAVPTAAVPSQPARKFALAVPEVQTLNMTPEQAKSASPSQAARVTSVPLNSLSINPSTAVPQPSTRTVEAPSVAPALPAPVEVSVIPAGGVPAIESPPAAASLNLLARGDAGRVQERLRALGYFNGVTDGVWGPRSRAALGEFRRTQGLGNDDLWDLETQAALISDRAVRAGSAPLGSGVTAASLPPPSGATRNPLNRPDALWAQSRLRELGFYSADGDGVWGVTSRDALRDFKAVNGLNADDTWDAPTEQILSDSEQIRADQTFLGGWASNLGDCGSDGSAAPVRISSRRAEAFGGVCEFDEVRRDGAGWRARGRCSAQGKSWQANIQLALNGPTLTWSSERGVAKYFRCR
ncbi:MAG: peptidoglycan-binding protein [Methylocella sp.]